MLGRILQKISRKNIGWIERLHQELRQLAARNRQVAAQRRAESIGGQP